MRQVLPREIQCRGALVSATERVYMWHDTASRYFGRKCSHCGVFILNGESYTYASNAQRVVWHSHAEQCHKS